MKLDIDEKQVLKLLGLLQQIDDDLDICLESEHEVAIQACGKAARENLKTVNEALNAAIIGSNALEPRSEQVFAAQEIGSALFKVLLRSHSSAFYSMGLTLELMKELGVKS